MTTRTTIADRVTSMHKATASQPPNEALSAFVREQAELAAAGTPMGVAKLGSILPDADLIDAQGDPTTLYATTSGHVSVLVFYRGAWCPYCNLTLAAYQSDLLPPLTTRKVTLIAVSPQTPDGSLTMAEKHALTFSVVSDPGNSIAGRLGILTAPAPYVLAAQAQLGLDLTTVNADGTTTIPMPTVAILDADHVLRWIDVHLDYTARTEVEDILGALDQSLALGKPS